MGIVSALNCALPRTETDSTDTPARGAGSRNTATVVIPLGPGPAGTGVGPGLEVGLPTPTDGVGLGQTPPRHPRTFCDPAELPEVLRTAETREVVEGVDAGDYYCEHTFFWTQTLGTRPGSSILRNFENELLVGFLHVPGSPQRYSRTTTVSQAERHGATREIIGAGMRAYVEDISLQHADTIRIALTGFGPFQSVINNPTGDFVRNVENLDASMALAFGPDLLTARGTLVETPTSRSATYRYEIRDHGVLNGAREILVHTVEYPVNDTILDDAHPDSIAAMIDRFSPQGVISMGVAGGLRYRVEFNADDGGLDLSDTPEHDGSVQPSQRLDENRSFAWGVLERLIG